MEPFAQFGVAGLLALLWWRERREYKKREQEQERKAYMSQRALLSMLQGNKNALAEFKASQGEMLRVLREGRGRIT